MNDMACFIKSAYEDVKINRHTFRTRTPTVEESKVPSKGRAPVVTRFSALCPLVTVDKDGDYTSYLNAPCHMPLKEEAGSWVACINLVEISYNGFRTVSQVPYLTKLVNDSFLSPMFDVVDVGLWNDGERSKVSLVESIRYTIPDDPPHMRNPLNISFHVMANVFVRQAWEFQVVDASFNDWIEAGAPVDLALFLSQCISRRYKNLLIAGHSAIYRDECPASAVGAILLHGKDVVVKGLLPEYCYYKKESIRAPMISEAFCIGEHQGISFADSIKKAVSSSNGVDDFVLPYWHGHKAKSEVMVSRSMDAGKFIDRVTDICCEEYTKLNKKEV